MSSPVGSTFTGGGGTQAAGRQDKQPVAGITVSHGGKQPAARITASCQNRHAGGAAVPVHTVAYRVAWETPVCTRTACWNLARSAGRRFVVVGSGSSGDSLPSPGVVQVVVDLDTGLQEFRKRGEDPATPRRAPERPWDEGQRVQAAGPGSSGPTTRVPFCCFQCNQLGHRAAECPAPSPRAPSSTPGKAAPKKNPEKSRAAQQPKGVISRRVFPVEEEEATVATRFHLVANDSKDDVAKDPMVEPW
ncbi:hypothetical protein NXF25_018877 [Crotalus adamanteus]|uniref:CCHC-type domain-containing protein n=1 Tax=Crotalus adamanteus TaxID=8729 RepID=A0AAW1B159_CROAD